MSKKILVKTQAVRLNNVNLITPLAFGDVEKYQTESLVNKKDSKTINAVNDAMDELIAEESKKDGNFADLTDDEKVSLKTDFLKDGNNHENTAYHQAFYFKTSNKQKPSMQKKGSSDQITKQSELYNGVVARLVIEIDSYKFKNEDNETKRGFYAKLLGVQKVKDMDLIDNSLNVNDVFNDDGGDDLW